MRLPLDHVVAWQPDRLAIDPWTVLRLARYRRRDEAPAAVWDATRAMTARAGELVAASARLRLVRVTRVSPDGAVLARGTAFSGHAIARHLGGARQAIAFVLTLGPALEAEVVALGERQDLLEAYLLDLAGLGGHRGRGPRAPPGPGGGAPPRPGLAPAGAGPPRLAARRAAWPPGALRGRGRARAALRARRPHPFQVDQRPLRGTTRPPKSGSGPEFEIRPARASRRGSR